MKTIVVPLDGSALAEQALPYARAMAKVLGAPIKLLRVIPDLERESLLVDSLSTLYVGEITTSYRDRDQQVLQILQDQAEGYLASQAEPIRMAGIEIELIARVGPPAEIIVEVAAAAEQALIVMATHGYSGIQRWALGSVADKVVHATEVPVMLVRQSAQTVREPRLKEILLPLDGSARARQVLPLAVELAAKAEAEIVLLHAIDPLVEAYPSARSLGMSVAHPDRLLQDVVRDAELHLGEIANGMATEGLRITTMSLIGYPAEAIVDEAERRHADLIVMTTHGYSGLRRWALGSVADKVLHNTRTPLLLVRAKA
jgi:nucleotide-binding universal stress UspA family protein